MEVAVGFRRRLPRGIDLEWSVIENIDPFYNTPDIGAFLGLNYSPGRVHPATASRAPRPAAK